MTFARTLALLGALTLPACSWLPGFDDAQATLEPRLILYELEGGAAMQFSQGGTLQNGAEISFDEFGATARDESFGGKVIYGDGFSGIEFLYEKVDVRSLSRGTLGSDFGRLPAGTMVTTKFFSDEYRLAYFGQLFEYETEEEALFRLGVGTAVSHREVKFVAEDADTAVSQEFRASDDGVPWIGGRFRAEYLGVGGQVDYLVNPDATFGGDWDGTLQDLELRASYTLEDQDLTFFGGYRWLDLPASGDDSGFDYDTDLELRGYLIGFQVLF